MGVEPTQRLYEGRMLPATSRQKKLEPAERVERSPDGYRPSVLPLNDAGLERVTGFEPVSEPWQGSILPLNDTRLIWSG